ncbi:Vacuole membrane protein 1 [Armadillidium nasatum]|uniref:Vacuole membrane protein 1 n=1 Tax=Armadillidium nasatum TaxID=96803 RepID=A0A5N5TGU3_9CRUS|nr:Vacuole membrane protein 1 [Armadillidium nasatum]
MMDQGLIQKQRVKKERGKQVNGTSVQATAGGKSLEEKLAEKKEREKLVLWRRPFTTLRYFILEVFTLGYEYLTKLWNYKKLVFSSFVLFSVLYFVSVSPGPHQQLFQRVSKQFWWCGWWVWLGILSSVGPHIASVTMAAYSCNSVDFPSPPYPDEIVCPDDEVSSLSIISILTIMSKVRLEAFMWGAGTALGELPPYFMARGARLSGYDPDDEEMAEFEELQRLKERPEEMSWLDRAKLSVEKLVEKVGFFGILACASIPNPLFDLAGITCGHFLVPFWTFFGATLIGKAVIKMHIQKLFVIIAFNDSLLEKAVNFLTYLPIVGTRLQKPDSKNILGLIFEKLLLVMIAYFVISIINSFAQSYHKKLCKRIRDKKVAKD